MYTLTDWSKQAILHYPLALLNQAYALVTSGTGAIQAALGNLKRYVLDRTYAHTPPPVPTLPPSLPSISGEILDTIMQGLNPEEIWALSNCCAEVRNRYSPETRHFFALQKKCVELLGKKALDENEIFTLKQCYRDLWLYLLDPQISDQDLRYIASLAEKCRTHLDLAEMKNIFMYAVLLRRPAQDLRAQWEKLAQINLYLCAVSSCLSEVLKCWEPCGMKDTASLSALLQGNTGCIAGFLGEMRVQTPFGKSYSALNEIVNMRFMALASALLKATPGLINQRSEGLTALMRMACSGNVQMVCLLLAHGADMALKDRDGNDALALARMNNHHDVVQILLDRKMAVLEEKYQVFTHKNRLDDAEHTELGACCEAIVSTLLDPATGETELRRMAALAEKYYAFFPPRIWLTLVEELKRYVRLRHGLQPQWEKLANANLHLCVTLTGVIQRGNLAEYYGINCDFLRTLLQTDKAEAFLSVLDEDNSRSPALHVAAEKGFLSVFPALLQDNPGRIDVPDKNGYSILAKVADRGDVELVRQLMQYHPNADIRDKD